LQTQDNNKTFDYEDGNFIKIIYVENHYNKTDELPLKVPWHHPNMSLRTSRIINMFEGSAMDVFAHQSNYSGLVPSFSKVDESHRNSGSVKLNNKEKDAIYIKRHLLKTRGVTALTRSMNNNAKNTIAQINRIERHRSSQNNKKIEKVNLQELINDTKKEFKIALYDL
jgi:hypothetical protein